MSGMPRHLFEVDGEHLVPTDLARGPWYPDTQHGSPMLGLLARAVERVEAPRPMQVTRLTVDLMRAAPMAPVRTEARVVRGGKSNEFLDAELWADGELCARATALRTRVTELALPDDPALLGHEDPPVLPDGEGGGGWSQGPTPEGRAAHEAFEMRPVPRFETPTVWFRLTVPLVASEATSPLIRVAAVSDFTYGISVMRRIRRDAASFERAPLVAINPDTTLNLHRPPEGEWICLDTRTHADAAGAATAMARLFDARGPVGYASQSLLVRSSALPKSWKNYRRRTS